MLVIEGNHDLKHTMNLRYFAIICVNSSAAFLACHFAKMKQMRRFICCSYIVFFFPEFQ